MRKQGNANYSDLEQKRTKNGSKGKLLSIICCLKLNSTVQNLQLRFILLLFLSAILNWSQNLSFSSKDLNSSSKVLTSDFTIIILSKYLIVELQTLNWTSLLIMFSIFLNSIIFSSSLSSDFQHKNFRSLEMQTYLLCGSEVLGECFITTYPFYSSKSIFYIFSKSRSKEIRLMKLRARDELYYDFISCMAFYKVERMTVRFFSTVLDVELDLGMLSHLLGFCMVICVGILPNENKLSNYIFFIKLSQFSLDQSKNDQNDNLLLNQIQKIKRVLQTFINKKSNPNSQKMKHDASQSRYLRKKYAKDGFDQQQEQQQKQFNQNIQKALETFSKKTKTNNIQSQVSYFGHMIQPFNMRQEQQMGDIDQQGYFVFKRRGEYRDAWLESIEQGNDMMVADKVKKKIKMEGVTFKGVYDEDGKGDRPDDGRINQVQEQGQQENDENEDVENDQRLNNAKNQPSQEQQQSQKTLTLQPQQIKQLICQLLPMNKSANSYIKQLKKNIRDLQTKELHDKILQLCNMYIEKTNEYDILTSKKEQLEEELEAEGEDEEKSEEINWDDEEEEEEDEKIKKEIIGMKRDVQQKRIGEKSNVSMNNTRNENIKRNTNNNDEADKQGNYSDDDIF